MCAAWTGIATIRPAAVVISASEMPVATSFAETSSAAAIASTVGAKTLGSPIIVGLSGFNSAYVIQGALVVGLLAVARVFMSLAAMDIGTAFGTLGARRDMMVGFLAEPALLMIIFVASLISATTALPLIAERLMTQAPGLYPSLAFTAVAFTMVLLAENARIPVDNPATHLELTMIHEAMVLEYSARHLALIEWASALKLFNYACIGFALFVPWGVARDLDSPPVLALALVVLCAKLLVAGAVLALIETLNAKIRIFRAPEFLALAFMLAVLGLLVRLLLQS